MAAGEHPAGQSCSCNRPVGGLFTCPGEPLAKNTIASSHVANVGVVLNRAIDLNSLLGGKNRQLNPIPGPR